MRATKPVMSRSLPVVLLIALLVGAGAPHSRAAELRWRGLDASEEGAVTALAALPATTPGEALRAALRVEIQLGARPPLEEERALARLAAAAAGRAHLLVALREATPVSVRDESAVRAWGERVAGVVSAADGRVAAWEIGGDARRSDEEQAFFVETTAVAVRSRQRAARILTSDPRTLPQGSIHDRVAPFVDGTAAPLEPAAAPPDVTYGGTARDADDLWRALVESAVRGVEVATFDVPQAELVSDRDRVARALETFLAAFPPDAQPTGNVPLVSFPGQIPIEAHELVVASDLSTRVVLWPRASKLELDWTSALVGEEPLRPRVFDPASGPSPTALGPPPRAGQVPARLDVPLVTHPFVLAWDRARAEDEVREDVSVSTQVEPTVEEILARHLAAQAARDARLRAYSADLTTEMRYEFGASGQSFDVRIEGRYFQGPDGVKEIENRRFFVNGARYEPRRGRPPEIPLLQPQSVHVVPLELRLDASYAYRLLGRDVKNGRPCWKIAIHPASADAAARGVAWIDAETWDRVAVSLVRTDLEPPVLTNEQEDDFGAVPAPDGEHWLVQQSRIHRTVSLLGAAVGIQMRMTFSSFRVNDPGFEVERQQALSSPRQMLRETEQGLQYLRATPDGGRELAVASSRRVFVLGGARVDESRDGVLPLAGVNWLDHDVGGRGLQMNLFAAGAINTLSLADPSLFGGRSSLGFDAVLPLYRRRDRLAIPGVGVDGDEVARSRSPRAGIEWSRPVGAHGRVGLTASLAHESWSRDDDAPRQFVPPADTWVGSIGAQAELHRRGWDAVLWGARHERSDWTAWGLDAGSGPPPLEGDETSFWTWGASVERTWPLTRLQTLGLDARALGGSGLDRFSQYEFGALGRAKLPGFDGSGIHFDQALLLRLSWGVDIAGVFGVQLQLGIGRTWNRGLPDAVEDVWGTQADHVGLALAGTVPGPLGTLVRFDVGTVAWSPDHRDAEGGLVAQVVVLKLLGGGSAGGRQRPRPASPEGR